MQNEWGIHQIGKNLSKYKNKCVGLRKKRFKTDDSRNFAEKRHAEISETPGVRLVGDYEQRRTGFTHGGEIRMF